MDMFGKLQEIVIGPNIQFMRVANERQDIGFDLVHIGVLQPMA